MKIIGGIVVFLALIAYRGVVVKFSWDWFVVPLGVVEIGYAHALGISLLAALLTHEHPDKEQKQFAEAMAQAAVVNTLFFAMLWAYAQFM